MAISRITGLIVLLQEDVMIMTKNHCDETR